MDRSIRILAIDSSGRHGSIALLSGGADGAEVISQMVFGGEERTAQVLAPRIQAMLRDNDWPVRSVGLVGVAVGPGSFTGLRIGVTTAKASAYAADTKLVGVNTLEAIADQGPAVYGRLWTILDAQRQELFAASFARSDAGQSTERETHIVSAEAWITTLRTGDHVSGPALSRLSARLPAGIHATKEDCWQPMAASIGRLAWKRYQRGLCDDLWQLVPQYYRSSAAEEKAQLTKT